MNKKLLILVAVIALLLVGCGTPVAAPTPVLPTNPPTAIPPTDIPTAVPPTAISIGGIWTTGADMPTPRHTTDICVFDGKIYVIGGAGPTNQAQDTVEVYDPVTDTWETKSPMPTAREALSVSVVNGKIYAIGGNVSLSVIGWGKVDSFSTVEEYDPETDTWTTKSPMPTSRSWHSASVVDGKIYIFGGTRDSDPGANYVLTVEVYDPATDIWIQKGDMPEKRAVGSISVVDGKIYLFGGHGGEQRVDEYDPLTDTWAEKSEMSIDRIQPSTSVLDGKIYLIGGYGGTSHYGGMTTVEVYDPATDTWTKAPDMPTARYGAATSVVDGKIYAFGGLPSWPAEAYGIVEVYELQKD